MELISEEEQSVCRSEGSPPRKKPRGKIEREQTKKKQAIHPVPITSNGAGKRTTSQVPVKNEKGLKGKGIK